MGAGTDAERKRVKCRGSGAFVLTAVGLLACAVFFVYGMKKGLFVSEEAMAQFLSGLGIWGPLVFVAIQVVQVVIPIMPGGISCLVGVLLFGPLWGFIYNYVGICAGSVLAFQIARKFGMPAVERAAGSQKIGRYLKWMDNGVFDRLFAAAIFFPASPDDLLCFIAGVTRMRFRKFFLIILLGKPLSIALYSLGLAAVFGQILKLVGGTAM
ncbi:MAG TPA: TVP38/TMEM64 family protein [Candidatus Eisenbergiella merdipullorum]|uniref:TVP38/TMEM64 family membrane protein n=1 Tax=Candidatus Eisenbergiella merdipullorum TaxID=2838553 RepID=A0A9D2I4U5_9FIRM|nr:TVP38/TMEM64 family protein [Candidatus Eisenbergiella merdipullorum]